MLSHSLYFLADSSIQGSVQEVGPGSPEAVHQVSGTPLTRGVQAAVGASPWGIDAAGWCFGHRQPAAKLTHHCRGTFLFTLAPAAQFWRSDGTVVFHSFTTTALTLACPGWELHVIKNARKPSEG